MEMLVDCREREEPAARVSSCKGGRAFVHDLGSLMLKRLGDKKKVPVRVTARAIKGRGGGVRQRSNQIKRAPSSRFH